MSLSQNEVYCVDVPQDLCQIILQWLRSHSDQFKQIDKQEEPPLRMLDHGIYGEGVAVPENESPPYPYMVKGSENMYYHGFRFDSSISHQVVHKTDGLEGILGANDEEAEAYFRLVLGYSSGKQHLTLEKDLVDRLYEVLMPSVMAVYGEQENPEAWKYSRLYSVYALAQLPGHSVNLHLDVPEFLGVDRSTCPSWLLVAAHASGLFVDKRVRNVTSVCYPASATGSALAVYNQRSKVYPVVAGTGIVLDADSCFHHSEQCRPAAENASNWSLPKEPIPVPHIPEGCKLKAKGNDNQILWHIVSPEGDVVSSHMEKDLRFSISCKFHVFRGKEELDVFEAGNEALTAEDIIEVLTEDLKKKKKLPDNSSNIPLHQLGPILVNEYIMPLNPSVEEVQNLWRGYYSE